MATPGIIFRLTDTDKEHAVKYVEESGFFKNRLADFLGISWESRTISELLSGFIRGRFIRRAWNFYRFNKKNNY
jgi:Mn-dependent DtxR family transcriptional regulator